MNQCVDAVIINGVVADFNGGRNFQVVGDCDTEAAEGICPSRLIVGRPALRLAKR